MKVVNLWRISSWKLCPQAKQDAIKIPFLLFALMTVSGFSQFSHKTNLKEIQSYKTSILL
jgi:hypothetical protein